MLQQELGGFRHASHPVLTKRKRKRLTARSKGLGEKQLYRPVGYIVGCPLCEWVTDSGTRRPVEQRIASDTKHVVCKQGHKFDITRG